MKKMAKHYSQHMYLFIIYSLFILCILCIFFFFTYRHYKKNALENAAKDLENMCASVENSVEIQLDDISTISMNLVYSNTIKINFKEFSNISRKNYITASQRVASRNYVESIHDIITAMIGAYQSAASINLYDLNGSCVESSYSQRITRVNLKEKEWYEKAIALNGHKYITSPVINKELPAKGDNQRSQKFISLVRLFLDASGQPEGFAEVVQDCGKVFSLASKLESQNPDSAVYIYNSRQELVYPYNRPAPEIDFYSDVMSSGLLERSANMVKFSNGEQYLITWKTIPSYDWHVILAKPKNAVYEQLHDFRMIFMLIGSLSIFLTLLICFYISRRLTVPLQKLTAATSKITISRVLDEAKVNLTSADSNITELSQLCESIRTMYEELRSTTQEALLSRTEETRAKLLATQSLINPHFLYNCLTNLSVMAEEEMNQDIIHMCHALCDYFRYITASKEMLVPLEEEIFYIKQYLECMRMRFSNELEYTLDIAQEAKLLYIPKLITQPIVENAFKYGFQIPPPWRLHITASLDQDSWIITIEDNGRGVTNQKKEELLSLYENLNQKEELTSMEIGGMGLKHVYLRLKLLYGDKAIFRIDNLNEEKTVFVVGGPLYRSREEYYEHHPRL